MRYQTNFDEFQRLATQGQQRVVVSKEIHGDFLTPMSAFKSLTADCEEAVLLDSSDHPRANHTGVYIGMNPLAVFTSVGQDIFIKENGLVQKIQGDVFQMLRDFFNQNQCSVTHPLAKFAGGLVGFMSYDAIRLFEKIPNRHANEDQIPDIIFRCYGTHIVFDKPLGNVLVAQLVEVTDHLVEDYQLAIQRIDHLIDRISLASSSLSVTYSQKNKSKAIGVEEDIDDCSFVQMVKKAKSYITRGDAFQIVLSRCFRIQYKGDDFNIYRALRMLNPSPYQFYIRSPDFTLVGASPERLVSVQDGLIETMPIAGTRPRGSNSEADQALEQDLLSDAKERAEHMMLVDLSRNDLGTVSEPGTVEVVEQAKLHRYSKVMHIVSRVQGSLRAGIDAFDVLRACFPAGTLSGAPKIRAMQIIDEIETSRRGLYGGAVVAIDNQGQMESCIAIRMAFIKKGIATVRAGCGVVLDSNPQKEAEETRHKAQAIIDAIALAKAGIV